MCVWVWACVMFFVPASSVCFTCLFVCFLVGLFHFGALRQVEITSKPTTTLLGELRTRLASAGVTSEVAFASATSEGAWLDGGADDAAAAAAAAAATGATGVGCVGTAVGCAGRVGCDGGVGGAASTVASPVAAWLCTGVTVKRDRGVGRDDASPSTRVT